MNSPPINGMPAPADLRRAAVLIRHANPEALNIPGVRVVLAEAEQADRITELIVALAVTAHAAAPGLDDEDGLQNIINRYTGMENQS